MKKSILALAAIIGLAAGNAAQAEPITVFGNDSVAPKAYAEGGEAKGYIVDAALEAFKRAGIEAKPQLLPWKRAYASAEAGQGWLTGVFRTAEREAIFDFSDPIGFDEVVLVVRKGEDFPFANPEDVAGKRIGYQAGASYGPTFVEMTKHFTADTDSDPQQRIKKLLAGRVDAIVINPGAAALAYHMKALGEDMDKISVLPNPIASSPQHLVIAKSANATEQMAKINDAVRSMVEDGTIKAIMAKYTN